MQQAVELFDKQQYRDAFEAFTEAYYLPNKGKRQISWCLAQE